MKELQVTLYEIFGYVLPGFPFLIGIFLLYLGIFAPSTVIQLAAPSGGLAWGALALSYFAGHAAQACGNLMQKALKESFPEAENLLLDRKSKGKLPDEIIEACETKAKQLVPGLPNDVSRSSLHQICYTALGAGSHSSLHDVYLYREGFYRGSAIGALAICAGLLSLLFHSCDYAPVFSGSGGTFTLTPGKQAFLLLLATFGTFLAFARYRRFAAYRVANIILAFAVQQKSSAAPNPSTSSSQPGPT